MSKSKGIPTSKQKRAIVALLSTRTVGAAAEQAQVGYSTLTRWLSEPVFRANLSAAETMLLDDAIRRLLQLQASALHTVEAVLQDSEGNVFARLAAAKIVFDYLIKLRELRSIEYRLAELEAIYGHDQATD